MKNKINKFIVTVLFILTFFTTLSVAAAAANNYVLKITYNANYGTVRSVSPYTNTTDTDGNIYHYTSKDSLISVFTQTIKDEKQDLLDANEIGLQRPGYVFKGWAVNPQDNKRILNETTKYTAKQIDNSVKEQDVEIVLKAVWEPVAYTASFDGVDVIYKSNDISNISNLTIPEKEGYVFSGWKTTEAEGSWHNGVVYRFDQIADQIEPYGNVAFESVYKPKQIVFDCVYDKNIKDKLILKYDDLSVCFYADETKVNNKLGYSFVCWNTKEDGSGINISATKKYSQKLIQKWFADLNSQDFSVSKTLYAVWKPNTIDYSVNIGGKTTKTSVFSVNSAGYLTIKETQQKYIKTVSVEDSITLPDAKTIGIYKTGFQLAGWKFGSVDKLYAPETSVKVYELYKNIYQNDQSVLKTDVINEITVSAVWEPDMSALNESISVAIITIKDESEKVLSSYLSGVSYDVNTSESDNAQNTNVKKLNSLRYTYSDPSLKSLLIACYMISNNKIYSLNQLTKEKIAEINTKDFKETIKSVLSKAYTTNIVKNNNNIVFNVSSFSFDSIIQCFNISNEDDLDPYQAATTIQKLIYEKESLCQSVDCNLDVVIPYGFSKVNGKSYNNKGLDVKTSESNTVLYALRKGTVVSVGSGSVSIDYGDGFIVFYSGLSEIYLERNNSVNYGEIIGEFQSTVHVEIKLNGTILPPDAGQVLNSLGFGPVFALITKDYDGIIAEEYKISNNNIIWIKPDTEPSKKAGAKSSETYNTEIFSGDYDYVSKGIVEINGDKWYSTEVYDVIETDEEFICPLPYSDVYLSSAYGERDSIDGVTSTIHGGIDLCCESGTLGKQVVSTASGLVIESGWNAYGNYILIEHENGIQSLYGHLNSRVAEEGDVVRAGELIGYAGSTYGEGGYSTGAHLHFEIRVNGNKVNPYQYVNL